MKQVQLYTRKNCSLCEEAKRTLQLVREDVVFQLNEIDIQQDDALHEAYMLEIPVVRYNNKQLENTAINYVDLLEMLANE